MTHEYQEKVKAATVEKLDTRPIDVGTRDVVGVEQTADVIRAGGVLTGELLRLLADGVDVTDAVALVMSSDVRDAVADAVDGGGSVPDELGNLSTAEAFELTQVALDTIKDALK